MKRKAAGLTDREVNTAKKLAKMIAADSVESGGTWRVNIQKTVVHNFESRTTDAGKETEKQRNALVSEFIRRDKQKSAPQVELAAPVLAELPVSLERPVVIADRRRKARSTNDQLEEAESAFDDEHWREAINSGFGQLRRFEHHSHVTREERALKLPIEPAYEHDRELANFVFPSLAERHKISVDLQLIAANVTECIDRELHEFFRADCFADPNRAYRGPQWSEMQSSSEEIRNTLILQTMGATSSPTGGANGETVVYGTRPAIPNDINLADLVDSLVVRSRERYFYFECGNHYSTRNELQTAPSRYLLPEPGLFNPLKWSVPNDFCRSSVPEELVRFERARDTQLHKSWLFICDRGWNVWRSKYDCIPACDVAAFDTSVSHAAVQWRGHKQENSIVNAVYMLPSTSDKCTCTEKETVLLCQGDDHRHCAEMMHSATENALVAVSTFGRATNRRWHMILEVCSHQRQGTHGQQMFDVFKHCIDDIVQLKGISQCLSALCRETAAPKSCRQSNPYHVTFALLVFIDARRTSNWLHAFCVWQRCVQLHCMRCAPCFLAISQSLWNFVVYNAMLPVLPYFMARRVEQFAKSIKHKPRVLS